MKKKELTERSRRKESPTHEWEIIFLLSAAAAAVARINGAEHVNLYEIKSLLSYPQTTTSFWHTKQISTFICFLSFIIAATTSSLKSNSHRILDFFINFLLPLFLCFFATFTHSQSQQDSTQQKHAPTDGVINWKISALV